MIRRIYYLVIICIIGLWGCNSPDEVEAPPIITKVHIQLDSVEFQKLYDFKDRWAPDSLIPYFSHEDPSFRALAAQLLGDLPNEKYAPSLGKLVLDPIVEVRRAAIYSLGQIRSMRAVPELMQLFEYQDSIGVDPLSYKYGLEAIGKCGDSTYLPLLASISTYQPEDELLLEGQCLGMLNLAIRGFSHPTATELMFTFVADTLYPVSVRALAAQYLATTRTEAYISQADILIKSFETETEDPIRFFLAECLGRTGNKGYQFLSKNFSSEKQDRIKIQMLKGSLHLNASQRHQLLERGLRDRSSMVNSIAGDYLIEYGTSAYSRTYTNWAFGNFPASVKAKIFAIVNRHCVANQFKQMSQQLLLQQMRRTSDPYQRAALIKACGYSSGFQSNLLQWFDEENPNLVNTSILEALIQIGRDQPNALNSSTINFLMEQWQSGDIAAVALISGFIADHPSLFEALVSDKSHWEKLRSDIIIPSGLEARIALDQAYAKIFNESYDPNFYQVDRFFTHPINWKAYSQLGEKITAKITTDQREFTLELFKEHAPGTVLNFVELAEAGYYNGKTFHRVVPNFVTQGGCNRGDGYGSLDYSIRSELGPGKRFNQSGLVGMASAGIHTESQQWFITHRPTPHLNGKYTIFGQLVEPIAEIQEIQPGETILGISINK